jgi:hypothetical protein
MPLGLENPMTKIRRLPETDLAEFCALPDEQCLKALRAFNKFPPTSSYLPVRAASADLLNEQAPMFETLPPSPWEKIELDICKSCWKPDLIEKNLRVGKSLHDFVLARGVSGRRLDVSELRLGLGFTARFWEPTAIVLESRLHLVFLDFRRQQGLSAAGRRIVFSFMHEHVRNGYPNYANAGLLILKFRDNESRTLTDLSSEGSDLLGYDELQRRAERTYTLWSQVLNERAEEARRRDEGGPLFGTGGG